MPAAPKPHRQFFPAELAPLAQWHLLESGFAALRAEGPAAIVPAVGAIASYALVGRAWCLLWAAATLVGVWVGRRMAARFDMRASDESSAVWARHYTAALWTKAALVGAGGVGIAVGGAQPSCLLAALPIGFALLQQAASATLRGTVRGEIMLLAAPLGVGCLMAGSKLAIITGGLFALQALAALALAGDAVARAQTAARRETNRVEVPAASRMALAPSVESFQRLLGRDQVTGLHNRHSFMHVLAQESARAFRAETQLSVLLVAWDGYDAFETANGPRVVDATVARIAKRLCTKLRRPGDIIANLGGGRFAIVLAFTDAFGAATVARNLQDSVRTPELTEGGIDDVPVAALSIGAATYCGKGVLPDGQLFQFAEEALVTARKNGGSTIHRYDPMAAARRSMQAVLHVQEPATAHAPARARDLSDGDAGGGELERHVIDSKPTG